MKFNFKKKPGSVIELEVELIQADFDKYYQPAFDEALGQVNLKGFRPGTAPKELAEKAVNREQVFEKAAQEAVKFSFNEVVHDNGWTIISQPEIKVVSAVAGLKYEAIFVILPDVKLNDYKKIAGEINTATREKLKSIEVGDKEIEQALTWLRDSRAKITTVNREVRSGDVIDINFDGQVDGKSLPEAKAEKQQFILGKGKFIPGFEENLIGRKAGDMLSFFVTAPDDYWKEDLRNKKIDFKVKVNNVLERELPELDDEFVKSLGKFDNVADLKKNIGNGIRKEKEEREKELSKIKIIEKISERVDMDIPKIMIDKTVEMGDGRGGKIDEKAAREKVVGHLIINKISQEENLNPSAEEIELEITKHQHDKSLLDNQKFYDYVYGILQNKKVFDYLETL